MDGTPDNHRTNSERQKKVVPLDIEFRLLLMLGLPCINYRLENHIFLNKTLIVECLCVEQHPILQSRMEN